MRTEMSENPDATSGLLTEIDHVAIAVRDLEAAIDYYQRSFGAFRRSVRLPKGADESTITANYADGVLEVALELPRESTPQRIPVV